MHHPDRPRPILTEDQMLLIRAQEAGETPLPEGVRLILWHARALYPSPAQLRWQAALHDSLAAALLAWETRNERKDDAR